MYFYYLCDDNETVYRVEYSIKQEDKERYLSLLENYLTEFVFVEENEVKKLVEEEIEKENEDNLSVENHLIFLNKIMVTNVDKIEDYLPFVVTVKTKKYFFLRSYTIGILITLLSKDIDKVDSPYIIEIASLLNNFNYIDFSLIRNIFLDESGNVYHERFNDYNSLMNLLRSLKMEITEKYSYSGLSCFWQGDDMERSLAEGIVTDSKANKKALKELNLEFREVKNNK